MGKNRSSVLIAIGVAVFVVGAGLAFLAVRSNDSDNTPRVQAAAQAGPTPKAGDVTAPGAAVPTFEIPKGRQALAVSMPYVSGVAGYAKAKDKVNVFGTVKPGSPVPKGVPVNPSVKMILSDIEVLAVTPGAAGGPSTFILSLTPAEAEQVVYYQSFEGLYLSLARSDQGVVSTPGRSAGLPF